MREHLDQVRLLWTSCVMSLAMTVVTTWFLWQASEWLARWWGQGWLWQFAFLTFGFLPSVAAITTWVWQRPSFADHVGFKEGVE